MLYLKNVILPKLIPGIFYEGWVVLLLNTATKSLRVFEALGGGTYFYNII